MEFTVTGIRQRTDKYFTASFEIQAPGITRSDLEIEFLAYPDKQYFILELMATEAIKKAFNLDDT